jgi:hypothetical protein
MVFSAGAWLPLTEKNQGGAGLPISPSSWCLQVSLPKIRSERDSTYAGEALSATEIPESPKPVRNGRSVLDAMTLLKAGATGRYAHHHHLR